MSQLRHQLQRVVRKIRNLQRLIRLYKRTIRTCVHEDSKNNAKEEMEKAKEELRLAELERDRLRDEERNIDFVS